MRPCHLDDAAIRIARALLFDNFDVMYGGRPREGFTAGFQDDSGAVVIEARLINYLGWPCNRALTAEQVADGFGVTRYVKVPWTGEDTAVDGDPWAIAGSATDTRRAVVRGGLYDLDRRAVPRPIGLVALGGQMSGFAGFLPGVGEEIAIALEQGIAVYVLGGFGGAAEHVAATMSGHGHAGFTMCNFMSNPKYQALRKAAAKRGRAVELRRRVTGLATSPRASPSSSLSVALSCPP